ncbi:hypothetical protein ACQPYA_31340 [Micromonospora sp. CA-263727]|uniref:hypothetical protein n=1 Tax=Micromonospora sp. CA-263727 TaxID=3239967 RepID=UPI003D8F6250
MSTGEFSGVDHDLLADYLGGALDGTPEEAEVARLVAQDPAWAQAHALLAPAVDGVRAELAAWGSPAPEMPAALADRILAALDAGFPTAENAASAGAGSGDHDLAGVGSPAVPVTGSADDPVSPADASDPVPVGAVSTVVPAQPLGGPRRSTGTTRPGQERPAPTRPGRRRRRWVRVAGPVALATVAVFGLGALQLARPNQGADTTAGTALSDPGPAAPHAYGSDESGERAATEPDRAMASATPFRIASPPQSTGTDYTAETLAAATATQPFATKVEPEISVQSERLAVPGDLERLGDQAALSACLAEIGTEHGFRPLVFDVVDYARFEGHPALVVRFTDGTGAHWAWVSGPECGIPGSGSDTRYRTRVG